MENHTAIAWIMLIGAGGAFFYEALKENRSPNRGRIQFFSFLIFACAVGVIYLEWTKEDEGKTFQARKDKLDEARHNEVVGNQKAVEPQISESLSILRRLEEAETVNEKLLGEKYPYGFMVFGAEGGNFVRMPFRSQWIDDRRIELTGDWKNARIQPAGNAALILVEDVGWRTIRRDGKRGTEFAETTVYNPIDLKKGAVLRAPFAGDTTWFIEVLDPNPVAPIFAIGFARTPK